MSHMLSTHSGSGTFILLTPFLWGSFRLTLTEGHSSSRSSLLRTLIFWALLCLWFPSLSPAL